jgi:hypothetical protein
MISPLLLSVMLGVGAARPASKAWHPPWTVSDVQLAEFGDALRKFLELSDDVGCELVRSIGYDEGVAFQCRLLDLMDDEDARLARLIGHASELSCMTAIPEVRASIEHLPDIQLPEGAHPEARVFLERLERFGELVAASDDVFELFGSMKTELENTTAESVGRVCLDALHDPALPSSMRAMMWAPCRMLCRAAVLRWSMFAALSDAYVAGMFENDREDFENLERMTAGVLWRAGLNVPAGFPEPPDLDALFAERNETRRLIERAIASGKFPIG